MQSLEQMVLTSDRMALKMVKSGLILSYDGLLLALVSFITNISQKHGSLIKPKDVSVAPDRREDTTYQIPGDNADLEFSVIELAI